MPPLRVSIYSPRLHAILEGPEGAVAKSLARRAARVESAAKVNASGRPGPRVRTGRLRSSIHWRLVIGPNGIGGNLYAEIAATTRYASWVEHGTRTAPPYPYLRPALSAARI